MTCMEMTWVDLIEHNIKHSRLFGCDDIYRANSWNLCYIGENRLKLESCGIRFLPSGCPIDERLAILGMEFDRRVSSQDVMGALGTIKSIDLRVNELGGK